MKVRVLSLTTRVVEADVARLKTDLEIDSHALGSGWVRVGTRVRVRVRLRVRVGARVGVTTRPRTDPPV